MAGEQIVTDGAVVPSGHWGEAPPVLTDKSIRFKAVGSNKPLIFNVLPVRKNPGAQQIFSAESSER